MSQNYYCKWCGTKYPSVSSLTGSSCSRNPTKGGRHELYDDNNFRNIFEQNGYLKRFVLIGHSCGGAIALLTVALAFYLYTTIEVYTFGAPCIFWLNSADSIIKESKNIRITNVRLNRDIIPKLLLPFGYRKNPGNHIVLESPYFNPIKSHLPDSYNKAIRNKSS